MPPHDFETRYNSALTACGAQRWRQVLHLLATGRADPKILQFYAGVQDIGSLVIGSLVVTYWVPCKVPYFWKRPYSYGKPCASTALPL